MFQVAFAGFSPTPSAVLSLPGRRPLTRRHFTFVSSLMTSNLSTFFFHRLPYLWAHPAQGHVFL